MKPRHAATIALQTPVQPRYREPEEIAAMMVCPFCLSLVDGYSFAASDGEMVKTWHCKEHGDVCPRRSAVANNP